MLPGLILTHALEGDDTAYGLALYPVPSRDPNDPLLVSICLNREQTQRLNVVVSSSGQDGRNTLFCCSCRPIPSSQTAPCLVQVFT